MEKRSRHFSKRLRKYSNPETAQRAAYRYFGKTAKIYPSSSREKKYDIYDPLTNINNNEKWLLLSTDNIMDYLKIIQNADELHINDLNMLLLLSTIDLTHIKIKYAYTNKFFIKTYFKELQNWKFIYN